MNTTTSTAKMVDTRNGLVWYVQTTEELSPIPAPIKFDISKIAAAQLHANSIRETLAPVVILDMSKVAQAQADARWIMSKFGK